MLHGEEYEATILDGEPLVPQTSGTGTQYQAWKWGHPEDLIEAAQKGSLCSNIYLKSLGMPTYGEIQFD